MRVPTVEIEFTEDTFAPDGSVQRDKGERARVDKISARSFCDIKKVARRVADIPAKSSNDEAAAESDAQ